MAHGKLLQLLEPRHQLDGLLHEIERRTYDVFRGQVRVPRWKKLLFALAVLPVRFGWT